MRLHEAKHLSGHDLGASIRIDGGPERDVMQCSEERCPQLVVVGKTRAHDVFAIIISTLQRPTARAADRRLATGDDRAAPHALCTTAQALDHDVVRHDELDEQVRRLIGEHLEQASSLSRRPGIAIEDEARLGTGELLLVEEIDPCVRYQLAGTHEGVRSQADQRCALYLVAEHVSAREMPKAQSGGELPGLRALAGTWRTDHHDARRPDSVGVPFDFTFVKGRPRQRHESPPPVARRRLTAGATHG